MDARRHLKIISIILLSSLIWSCGGSSGGSNLLRDDIEDRGRGNPFNDISLTRPMQELFANVTRHAPYEECTTGTEINQSVDCADKESGYFRGPPPRLNIQPPGSNTGFLQTQNPQAELLDSATDIRIYEQQTLGLENPFHLLSRFNNDENMLVHLTSTSSPDTLTRLTVHNSNGNELCRAEGPIDGLTCFGQATPSRIITKHPQILYEKGSLYAFVKNLSDVEIEFSAYVGANITDTVNRNFSISPQSLPIWPRAGAAPISIMTDELGFGTFFIYLPRHDITVFQHKPYRRTSYQQQQEASERSTQGYNSQGYLRIRPSEDVLGLRSENREKADKIFESAIKQLGELQVQIYHGDLTTSMILDNEIPEQNRAWRWSLPRSLETTIYVPPPSSSGSGGTGSSGGGSAPSGDTDALGGNQTIFRHTCSTPGSTQMEIPVSTGPCRTAQENYARVFACNDLNNFASACRNLYQCATNNSSGYYVTYYQSFLSGC